MTTLAIDIGGTKLAAALIDTQHRPLEKRALPTPASKTSVALTEALSALVAPFAGRARRVAVASTGIIGHGVLTALNPDNMGGLAQFPLRETLEQLTGLPCLAVNDAQAAAWAEYHALAVDAHEMVFITISTGVGGGIVCHGQLLSGKEGLAGHIGHTLADPHGPRCGCGRIGCVEAIASGRGIAALATDDLQGMTAKTIFALAQIGHSQATSLVHRSAQTIARLIADMKASFNCQCAVLGGSIGLAPGYIPLVERYLAQEPAVYHTPIVAAHYQHDAGLIGAALLAEDKAL
ncbi:N-acetylmannosamine kinase [Klebsiella michiganensis]|uniref:N-acetylmannosamine kinase n=1 Tax=Klebsiella michiganensis TaxID=1134687 RepID=UPI000FEBAE8B|nr:N-acetylmannosamine kinase [Klebsiella michiganensis]QLS22712.1 N-acetylmannosamine kinase [Klebsiella michiganensis]RWS83297.1 N-acetylmannosamine kinase [Klebsiella michiganensis]